MGPHRNPNAIDECLSFSNHEARIVVEIESNRFIGQAARVKIRAELGVKVEPTPSWHHAGRLKSMALMDRTTKSMDSAPDADFHAKWASSPVIIRVVAR